MNHVFLLTAGLSGCLAVGLGAFGAHALRERLPADMMAVYQTAVHYHFVHTLALLAAALLLRQAPANAWWQYSGAAQLVGLLLFSGSLYLLALGGPRWLGMITPLGGLAFMAGWLLLALGAWRAGA